MKWMTTLLFTIISSHAVAAVSGDTEITCDYIIATTTRTYNGIKVTPSEERGQITLKSQNGVFQTEIPLQTTVKIALDATLDNSAMNLNVKVTEARSTYSTKILVSTTSIHTPNAQGEMNGTMIVRSPDVETLAFKNKLTFDAAAMSESLPTGLNFIGAMFNCH